MATNDNHICDICSKLHVTSNALVWCPLCEENFCGKCNLHHTVAKATRKHETIATENVSKLPQFVRDIEVNCSKHDESFIYFCSKHEMPCCVECVKQDHSGCCDFKAIQHIVQDVKSSISFLDLEALIKDILTNIDNMIKDRKDYMASLKAMKSTFVEDLKTARAAIDDYFDKLERQLLVEMEQSFSDSGKESLIEPLISELTRRKENVAVIQEQLGLIKSYAPDFQTFFALREIVKSVAKEEHEIQILFDSDSLKWITLTLEPIELKVVNEHFSSFGKIHIFENPCKLKSVARKVKEAQLMGNKSKPDIVQDTRLKHRIRVSISKLREKHMRRKKTLVARF